MLCTKHTILLKTIVAKDSLFWLVSIVKSPQLFCERGVLALWCHIRQFFLHEQIGEQDIFTGE